jgi:hypothetical protein
MESLSKKTHIKNGKIFYNKFCVDPLFYSLRKVRWDIMLTFHYKTADYYRDNEFSEKNRRILIKKGIVIKTLKTLRQPINDIQFAGFTEKKNGRCHSHTLLHIKDKSPLSMDIIADTIKLMIPHEIIIRNSKDEEKQIEFIRDSEAAAAYICKFNSNEYDIHKLFKSKALIEYVSYH